MVKFPRYAKWHSWQFKRLTHNHVHLSVAILWVVLVVFLVSTNIQLVSALSIWNQTDWSGGQGSSTNNQYASENGIDTSVSGSLALSKTNNSFVNSSFDASINSWNGNNLNYDTSNTHTGSGSTKITAGGVSSNLFYGQTTYSSGATSPHRLALGDLNNDGIDDTVITNTSGTNPTIEVRFNNGTGGGSQSTLATYESRSWYVEIQDMNNDNWNDIIFSNYLSSCKVVSIYLNSGNGTFPTRNDYNISCAGGYRTCDFAIADFNIDGYKDFVQNCNSFSYVRVWTNNGSGDFSSYSTYNKLPGTYGNFEVVATDINGDSKPDIVYGYGINETPSCTQNYMLNNGGGFDPVQSYTLQNCSSVNVGAGPITSADLNADGFGDVIMCRRGYAPGLGQHITVLFGSASGSFANQADYPISSQANYCDSAEVAVADISGDGLLDLAVSSTTSNTIITRINTGLGVLGSEVAYATGTSPTGLATGDVNGDGKIDISVANTVSNTISVLVNRVGGDAMTQAVNLGNTDKYQIEAYIKTNGSAVTSADATLFANGGNISTTFTDVGSGWYKLIGIVTAVNSKIGYGVQAKQGKTIYVDDLSLYKYSNNGNLSSSILDLGYGGDWGSLIYTTDKPSNTFVKVRTSNNSDMSGAPNFSGCSVIANGSDLTGQSCVNNNERYVQYEIALTNDNGATPTIDEINIQYDAWDSVQPTANASNLVMKKISGGQSITENAWTNGSTPYFSWDAGVDADSGIKGYCLYLGNDNTSDPATTKGLLGSSPINTEGHCQFLVPDTFVDFANAGYIGSSLTTSNTPYYLIIKAIDNAGNLYPSTVQFTFKFDNTPLSNPAFINAPSQFVASKNVTVTWPTSGGEAASDHNSGVAGLQYKIGNTTWYGDSHNGSQDSSDLLVNDGSYATTDPPDYANINEGNNTVFLRTWDQAGNISETNVTSSIKLNTNAPSSPQNVSVSPATNSTNSFAFNWLTPSSYQGSSNNLTYCYTINTLPTVNTCTFTDAGTTNLPAGAFATQPGDNTFYVVAKDEAGNINYATASSVTFTANTSAPGIPMDMDVVDVSVKATSAWKLAITWEPPTNVGAGVASYKILRSNDNNSFTQIASTSGTSYVDSNLSQQQYYYKVKACDSANNCGAFSTVKDSTPTGKFTSPAEITAQPSVSNVSTKKATIKWATDRKSDSKISLGTSTGQYDPFQVASQQQVTDHSIELTNLTPGTTYFAKAVWTDEDGNTGLSSEFSFKTEPAPSTQEVITQRIGLSSAVIRFTSVSASKVVVQFGKSDSFGGIKEVSTSLSKSSYDVELPGLEDGSKYFYRLNTFDADGNEYTGSTTLSFTTPARPRISNLRFQPVEGEPTSTQKVTWTTNVPASSLIRFSSAGIPTKEVSNSKLTLEHEIVIKDLQDDTSYTLTAESRDEGGNLTVSDNQTLKTALDTRPPKISDIAIETTIRGTGAEARGQIVVSWKTDEPATSQVAYGEGSQVETFNNKTAEDGTLALEHIVIVSDLPTSRVYSVQPISKDHSQNTGNGETKSAIIAKASDSILTIVLGTLKKIFGF